MPAAQHGPSLKSLLFSSTFPAKSAAFTLSAAALLLAVLAPSGSSALPMQSGSAQRNAPDFLKRAGFVGMRGKKGMPSLDESGAESDAWLLDDDMADLMSKRAGFVGMRGKKFDAANRQAWLSQLLNKRAGFVGMRGKKGGSSSEEGWGKRAGFVGMRGKKSETEPAYFMENPDLDGGALLPLDWANQISGMKTRRGSSGFVGMRG